MKKLLIILLAFVITACNNIPDSTIIYGEDGSYKMSAGVKEKKEITIYTNEDSNPYLRDGNHNPNPKFILKDIPKFTGNPKIIQYSTYPTLIQGLSDLISNQNLVLVGYTHLDGKNYEGLPTKRDLQEAGIIIGSDLIFFTKVDDKTLSVGNFFGKHLPAPIKHLRDTKLAKGEFVYLAYFLRTPKN